MSGDRIVTIKQVISDLTDSRIGRAGRIDKVFKRADQSQNLASLIDTIDREAFAVVVASSYIQAVEARYWRRIKGEHLLNPGNLGVDRQGISKLLC